MTNKTPPPVAREGGADGTTFTIAIVPGDAKVNVSLKWPTTWLPPAQHRHLPSGFRACRLSLHTSGTRAAFAALFLLAGV
jgi:hypothetical protein